MATTQPVTLPPKSFWGNPAPWQIPNIVKNVFAAKPPETLASQLQQVLKKTSDQVIIIPAIGVNDVKDLAKSKTEEQQAFLQAWKKLDEAGFTIITKSSNPDGTGDIALHITPPPSRHAFV